MKFLPILLFLALKSMATVKLPLDSIPGSLSVLSLTHVNQGRILSLARRSLFSLGEQSKIVPEVAESYHWSDGGKILNVRIKKIKFSDGTPVSAKHVAESLNRCIFNKKSVVQVGFDKISGYHPFVLGKTKILSGLKAKDSETITIRLSENAPLLLDRLSHTACSIIKPGDNGSTDFLKGALGTGPYKILSASNDSIILTRNPHFSDSSLGPRSVEFIEANHIGNATELSSWADLIINPNNDDPPPGYRAFRYSQLGSELLVFNNSSGKFRNKRLREAVSRALNAGYVLETLKFNKNRAQKGLFPYGLRGFIKRTNLAPDTHAANKILKAEGFSSKQPLSFTVLVRQNAKTKNEIAAWKNAFAGAYIKPKVKVVSHKQLVDRRNSGDFEAIRVGKAPGSIDPYLILVSLMSGVVYNTPKANYPDCDRKTVTALREIDIELRHTLYKLAEKCFLEKYVVLPLASFNRGSVFVKRPWRPLSKNQYLLKPFDVFQWRNSDQ